MNVKKFKARRDGRSSFGDLVEYMSDAEKTNGSVWVLNCISAETAELEMTAVAQLSKRVKDPAVHLMASWKEGEEPTEEQALEAGKIILKQLGLDEEAGYLSMIALHRDTGNFHIHIGACRVHPETEKAKQLPWVDRELSVSARRVELAQGWATDNGLAYIGTDGKIYVRSHMNGKVIYVVDPSNDRDKPRFINGTTTSQADWENHVHVNDVARAIEAHNGTTSFDTFYRETVGPPFKLAVETGSWEAVHKVLGEYGVKIDRSGGGYAVSDLEGQKGWRAKAGAVGRWGRAERLEKKLGEFREAAELTPPKVRYNPDAPHGKEVAMPHGMLVDPASSSVEVQRSNLRVTYRKDILEARETYKDSRKLAKARMQAQISKLYKTLTNSRRAFESNAWAKRREMPKRFRPEASQFRSMLRSKAAREREPVDLQAKLMREAFGAEWDARRDALKRLSFPNWLRAQELGGSKSATEILREMASRHSVPVIGAAAKSTDQAPSTVSRQSLTGLVGRPLPGGPVEYLDQAASRPVMTDYGRRIVSHDSREASIEGGLRLAREKFGKEVTITGPIEWRKLACQKAAELNMEVVNPDSRPYWEEARQDLDRQRRDRELAARRPEAEAAIKANEARMAGFDNQGELAIGIAISLEEARYPRSFDTTAPGSGPGGEQGIHHRWDEFERRYREIRAHELACRDNGLHVLADHAGESADLLKARHYAKSWENCAEMAITNESRQAYQAKAQVFAEQVRALEGRVEDRRVDMIEAVNERDRRTAALDQDKWDQEARLFNDAARSDKDWGEKLEYTQASDAHVAKVLIAGNMPEANVREVLLNRSPMIPGRTDVSNYLGKVLNAARGRETAREKGGPDQAPKPPSI